MGDVKSTDMSSGQGADKFFNEEFGKFAKEQLETWKVPGISVGVVDGEDIFAEGYGFASLPDKAATADTLWYAGSTTKAHLAAAIAILIDSKKYPQLANGWSTTLSSIMRGDFVLQDEWATAHLTLEDAVCHRTGFGAYNNPSIREIDGRQATLREIVRTLRNFPSWHEPRTEFLYCNYMYVVLSHAVETITGKPLEETLRELIWEPLGMKNTYFTVDDAQKAGNFADGYYFDDKAAEFKWVAPLTLVEVSGAGAIISTARDFAKWVKCLVNEDKVFSENVHKDIRNPRSIARGPSSTGDFTLYGLGWERTLYKGHVLYKHSGGVHSGSSMVIWLPESKFGVVGFGNTALTSYAATNALLYRLIDQKLGIPEADRIDFVKEWGNSINGRSKEGEDPVKTVYKDKGLPEPPLPSPFTTEELVGTYSDPAWGELTFERRDDGKKVLVASRPEMTWKWEMGLIHGSGDHWVASIDTTLTPDLPGEYLPAKFVRGPDGKVSELVVDWLDSSSGKLQCRAVFKRAA